MLSPNDSKQAKVQARRDQIVEAAKTSFRRHGFHAASMAEIAQGSQLSVGQIYRYFTSKDAIIEEMIRRIIDSRIAEMEGKTQTQHLALVLAWRQTLSQDDDALMLEVAAEATRNPRVAAMMEEADTRMYETACAHLKKTHPHLDDDRVRCGVEIMATLMEGTMLRSLTPQKCDPTQLHQMYQDIMQMLFAEK